VQADLKTAQRTADPTGDYDKKEPMEPEISNNYDTGKRYLIQADTVGKSLANPRQEAEMDTKDSDSNLSDSFPPKEGSPERGLLRQLSGKTSLLSSTSNDNTAKQAMKHFQEELSASYDLEHKLQPDLTTTTRVAGRKVSTRRRLHQACVSRMTGSQLS
jgi:hypothetical protein